MTGRPRSSVFLKVDSRQGEPGARRRSPGQVVSSARDGMTLLEVLVALAIFLLSLVAIGRLVNLSSAMALDVQLRGEAMLKCQSKMAEIASGVQPLTSQSDVAFEEDPDWSWSADCNQGQIANLWTVQVRVSKQRADGGRVEVTLNQMVFDPTMRGTTIPSTSASGASGTSSGTGTTTGGM